MTGSVRRLVLCLAVLTWSSSAFSFAPHSVRTCSSAGQARHLQTCSLSPACHDAASRSALRHPMVIALWRRRLPDMMLTSPTHQSQELVHAKDLEALVISGPSGVGKGSIIQCLLRQLGSRVALCISHTSRKPRHGEQDGVHYYYRERQDMAQEIAAGGFLEHAEVHGNLYGTSRKSLQEVVAQGKMPILDVDVQGAEALRASGLQGLYVFIAPPSAASLEQRLRGRGTESGAGLEERLAAASRQLAAAEAPGLYDVRVVNDELEAAVESLRQQVVPLLRQRPRVVFILGGPGSGKGTQSQRLVESFGYRHLSAGDLLRAEQASDSPQAQLIKSYIQDGKIVPVDITCGLLLKAMTMEGMEGQEGRGLAERVFLIDGFPRNVDNLEGWQRVVGARAAVSFVLVLDCPLEVMEERILERGKTSGRADDNLAALHKRFRVLREETSPVIDSLAARGLVHRVQGDQSADAVFAEVARVFADQLPPLD